MEGVVSMLLIIGSSSGTSVLWRWPWLWTWTWLWQGGIGVEVEKIKAEVVGMGRAWGRDRGMSATMVPTNKRCTPFTHTHSKAQAYIQTQLPMPPRPLHTHARPHPIRSVYLRVNGACRSGKVSGEVGRWGLGRGKVQVRKEETRG